MSIVACTQCGKKISSNSAICDHCGHEAGEVSEADLHKYQERRLRSHIYHLKMATYAVMTVVAVAIGWYWIESGGFVLIVENRGPFYLLLLSGLAYVVIRIMLLRARRRQRTLRNSG